jgi:hypothetical protein
VGLNRLEDRTAAKHRSGPRGEGEKTGAFEPRPQRGRKSRASLSLLPTIPRAPARPEPPAEVSELEAAVWQDVVGAQPKGWTSVGVEVLLRLYCSHCAMSERLGRALRGAALDDAERFDRMVAMQSRQTAMAVRWLPSCSCHEGSLGRLGRSLGRSAPKPNRFALSAAQDGRSGPPGNGSERPSQSAA